MGQWSVAGGVGRVGPDHLEDGGLTALGAHPDHIEGIALFAGDRVGSDGLDVFL